MDRKPQRPVPKEYVAQDPDGDKQRLQEDLERTSSVPSAFSTKDPALEKQLLGDKVVHLLLRQMQCEEGSPPLDADLVGDLQTETVAPEDIRELLASLENVADEPAPDLMEDLQIERLWILMDMCRRGEGLARQRATHELRDAMRDLRLWEGVNRTLLSRLADLLREARQGGDMPLLFQTLDLAVARALVKIDSSAASEAGG